MLPERGQRAVDLEPRSHDAAERLVRQEAVRGPEGHLLVEVALAGRAVGASCAGSRSVATVR